MRENETHWKTLAWRRTQPYTVVKTEIDKYLLRWRSLWGPESLYWVGETQAAKAVIGGGGRMRVVPLEPSVGPPHGATKR
eukprot:5258202-Pyramimonas_sp.AAC.1